MKPYEFYFYLQKQINSSRASPIHSCLQESIIFCLGGGRRGATLHKITFFSSHFTGHIKGTFKYRNGLFNFLCQQTVIIKITS